MYFKKVVATLTIFLSVSFYLFAGDMDDYIQKEYTKPSEAKNDPDDYDDLFKNSEDVVVEEKKEAPKPASVAKPITLTGYLKSDVGAGFSVHNKNNPTSAKEYIHPAAVFRMTNYVYMTARANDILSIRGTLKTTFPEFNLSLHEIYFEYLLLDRFFLQAGKRDITWGNMILKQNNILNDSHNGLSISVSVPFWKLNFTGLVMYQLKWGASDLVIEDYTKTVSEQIPVPSWNNISLAGALEGVFGPFQMNLFFRKWPDMEIKDTDPNKEELKKIKNMTALGLEWKLSLKGYDLYNQIVTNSNLTGNPENSSYLDNITCKTGFMKDWEEPRIGFDIEYHYTYYNKNLYPSKVDSHVIYFKGLVSRLFNNTSKFGLETQFDISNKSGKITPGYIFYKISNAELRVGIPIEYEIKDTKTIFSVIPVCYLEFDWHY